MKKIPQKNQKKVVRICRYCNTLLKNNKLWEYERRTGATESLTNISQEACPDCLKENFPQQYLIIQEEKKVKISKTIEKGLKDFYGHIAR